MIPVPADTEEFERWLCERLKQVIENEVPTDEDREWWNNGGPQIVHAEFGDIEPLRRRFPLLEKYLHLPIGEQGKRRDDQRDAMVDFATEEYKRALEIVKATFGTIRKKQGQEPVSAIVLRIVARRNHIEPRRIENRLKNNSRRS